MYEPSPYLLWARQFYGRVPYDLASSGMVAPPAALRAFGGAPDELDDLNGPQKLRAAIAHYNDVPEREVAAALGTSHAAWLACASVLRPNDEVLIEAPTYGPLEQSARALGAQVVRFSRVPEEGYALDPERVEAALTDQTKLVIVTNLHNPSGVRTDESTLAAVAQLAARRSAFLLVDEVYAPFDTFTDGGGVFRASARKLGANVLAVSSLTKCYGLGLSRIGWLLGPEAVVVNAEHVVTLTLGVLPFPHANMGAMAFSRIAALAEHAREVVRGKRAIVEEWLGRRPDLAWSGPREGLYGFAIQRGAGDLTPAIEQGIAEKGVIVAAGKFFGVENGFRISWVQSEACLREALGRLDSIIPIARAL